MRAKSQVDWHVLFHSCNLWSPGALAVWLEWEFILWTFGKLTEKDTGCKLEICSNAERNSLLLDP